jgi:DDE superfamily endonuclease/Archaeal putative transposase ISC1217
MWPMIPSLDAVVQALVPAFTLPSFHTHCQLVLGWVMCLGQHRLCRVADSAQPQALRDHSCRHGLDTTYNFFARSAWSPKGLAYHVTVLILTRLKFCGRITLLVDDTLAHKRGQCVWGLGWWRDAVASTKKRVATASGHNWVVLAVAYCLPCSNRPVFAVPLLARLHLPGKGQPSCAALAKEMLAEVLGWFPSHTFTVVADGAYACTGLLRDLDERVVFVGRMRGDACVYDPKVPKANQGKRGRKAKKGPKLPKPKEAAAQADRKRTSVGQWLWHTIEVVVYGASRSLAVVSYEAVWPRVLGLRPIQILVVRDLAGRMQDCYLFTTDLKATANWVVTQFAWRWAIEVLFRSSKQVMDLEAPQHWSQESVEKVAPWVWSMQSVVMVWYFTAGHSLPEALELRAVMGEWDSEWSLQHMVAVLRRATLNATIEPMSAEPTELLKLIEALKNCVNLAA